MKSIYVKSLVIGTSLALGLFALPALSQVSSTGGPVMIGSDRFTADQKARTQTLTGRVQIQQGDSRLQADNVVITYSPGVNNEGNGDVQTIEAKGNVYYVTPKQTIKGDVALYTAVDDKMVISGTVVLTQDKNVMQGNKLTMNIKEETSQMEALPASETKGRVRAVFYPKSENR